MRTTFKKVGQLALLLAAIAALYLATKAEAAEAEIIISRVNSVC